MYNITLAVLGQRLKMIREHLKYSQSLLADELNCKQNAISNLELGKGGSITLLLSLLKFYSEFVYIDSIFSNRFYLISNNDAEVANKSAYQSMIESIITQSETEFDNQVKTAKNNLNEQLQNAQHRLKENLQKAKDLL